jgi:hypothetical protein
MIATQTTGDAALALVTRRVCCRWIIRWTGPDGGEAQLRGVDVITVRGGKIAEQLSYGTL